MKALKARVENGRIRLDEPTAFPEGTELDLSVVEPGDELEEHERAALHAALEASWAQALAGDVRPLKTIRERK